METLAISKFKATCLAVLERVRRTGQSVRVTRFGAPIAEVVPPSPLPGGRKWLGSRRGTGAILGDIVSPAVREDEWEVLRVEGGPRPTVVSSSRRPVRPRRRRA